MLNKSVNLDSNETCFANIKIKSGNVVTENQLYHWSGYAM